MATVAVGTFFMPRTYQSEAKLMVRLGRESVSLDPTATVGQIVNIGQDRENEINSELEILNSRDLTGKVVDAIGVDRILDGTEETGENSPVARFRNKTTELIQKFGSALSSILTPWSSPGPNANLRQRELAIDSVRDHLRIEAKKLSNIIYLSYEASSKQLAHDVLQKLIDFYLDKHISVYRTAGSYQFFKQQAEDSRKALTASERQLKDLKNKTGTASLEEQQRILLERIDALQSELEATEAGIAASAAKEETLQKILANVPKTVQTGETTGIANSSVDELRKRLNEMKLKEQELLSTFVESSVPVQEIRRRINEARALLNKAQQPRQLTKGLNTTYQQLETDLLKEQGNLTSLQAKSSILKEQLTNSRGQLDKLNEAEVQLDQLEREVKIRKSNYQKYSESLEQARIDQALEMQKISNITVVQPASLPVRSIWPKTKVNLAVGILLGLIGGLGLAFLSEFLDHTFKKPEDVEERLQIPVLASLPVLELGHRSEKRAVMNPMVSERTNLPALYPALRFDDLDVYEFSHEAADQSISLWTENARGAAHVLALTSCRKGEGVSTVAAQLAVTLAHRNIGRVLLVDSNFKNATLHHAFGMSVSPGLADILVSGNGSAASIRPTFCDTLDVLCCGQKHFDLSSLSRTEVLANLFNIWRHEYNFIVIDTPALDENGAAVKIAGLADEVILVLEAEAVRWEVAQRALDRLNKAKANVSGVILNKRRYYIPDWAYRRL